MHVFIFVASLPQTVDFPPSIAPPSASLLPPSPPLPPPCPRLSLPDCWSRLQPSAVRYGPPPPPTGVYIRIVLSRHSCNVSYHRRCRRPAVREETAERWSLRRSEIGVWSSPAHPSLPPPSSRQVWRVCEHASGNLMNVQLKTS